MKTKLILLVVLLTAGAGAAWFATHPAPAPKTVTAGKGAPLYYTCAMHPWVRESKPGPCPVCGMNLTPIFAIDSAGLTGSNTAPDTVTLEPDSISTINVQTDVAARRPVRRTIHLAGEIIGNSSTIAWFEFTAYERDLSWLKLGQTFDVSVPSSPDKMYAAQIKLRGSKPFADTDFDMMTGSVKVRAVISDPPITAGDFGKEKLFNGLHAEAHLVAETGQVLTVPRTAVISRGLGPIVYVDKGDGHYAPRVIELGRIGDQFAEVLSGLKAGEKVVTTGNLLIDSEAQLTAGE